MAASCSRVVTTWKPRADRSDRKRTLRARVKVFSLKLPMRPPGSSPPWAASRTTTNRAGGGGAWADDICAAGAKRRSVQPRYSRFNFRATIGISSHAGKEQKRKLNKKSNHRVPQVALFLRPTDK